MKNKNKKCNHSIGRTLVQHVFCPEIIAGQRIGFLKNYLDLLIEESGFKSFSYDD